MPNYRTALFMLSLLLSGFKAPVAAAVGNAVFPPPGNADTFLEVKAGPGDDVIKLLDRYALSDYDCNVSRFFEINGLAEDYRLKNGKTYKLPVLVVRYNGTSIRSTLKIDDWQKAVRIKEYNERALKKSLRNDDFIASKVLWVPWHELHCDAPEGEDQEVSRLIRTAAASAEPLAASGKRYYPIFGKKYASTPQVSRRLSGKVYYVISGHGGPDVGAQGKRAGHTLCEDEYAYDVSLRLVRLLVSHGAIAYMVVRDPDDGIRDGNYLGCDTDEYVWGDKTIPTDQKERLGQRTDLVNSLYEHHLKAGRGDQYLIEIHVDSRSHDHRTDVFFYHRPNSTESKKLADGFHRKFLQKYTKLRASRGYSGTVTPRALYTLRETKVPNAVYVELANIRNEWDQQRLVLSSNRQALANWMLEALFGF